MSAYRKELLVNNEQLFVEVELVDLFFKVLKKKRVNGAARRGGDGGGGLDKTIISLQLMFTLDGGDHDCPYLLYCTVKIS